MTYSPDRDDLRRFQPRWSLGLLHELLHGSGIMRRGSTTADDSISRAIARTELVICCPAGKAAPLPAPGWHSRSSPVLALLVPTTMERSSWSRAWPPVAVLRSQNPHDNTVYAASVWFSVENC